MYMYILMMFDILILCNKTLLKRNLQYIMAIMILYMHTHND